jgi:hypothetical protein
VTLFASNEMLDWKTFFLGEKENLFSRSLIAKLKET